LEGNKERRQAAAAGGAAGNWAFIQENLIVMVQLAFKPQKSQ
jgi:hypothetical protein